MSFSAARSDGEFALITIRSDRRTAGTLSVEADPSFVIGNVALVLGHLGEAGAMTALCDNAAFGWDAIGQIVNRRRDRFDLMRNSNPKFEFDFDLDRRVVVVSGPWRDRGRWEFELDSATLQQDIEATFWVPAASDPAGGGICTPLSLPDPEALARQLKGLSGEDAAHALKEGVTGALLSHLLRSDAVVPSMEWRWGGGCPRGRWEKRRIGHVVVLTPDPLDVGHDTGLVSNLGDLASGVLLQSPLWSPQTFGEPLESAVHLICSTLWGIGHFSVRRKVYNDGQEYIIVDSVRPHSLPDGASTIVALCLFRALVPAMEVSDQGRR